jgi:hypothetical protein
MAAFAFYVRRFFHRFTLHAAVFACLRSTRTIRMSALFCFLSCHFSLLRPVFRLSLHLGIPLPRILPIRTQVRLNIRASPPAVCSKSLTLPRPSTPYLSSWAAACLPHLPTSQHSANPKKLFAVASLNQVQLAPYSHRNDCIELNRLPYPVLLKFPRVMIFRERPSALREAHNH